MKVVCAVITMQKLLTMGIYLQKNNGWNSILSVNGYGKEMVIKS